MVKTRRANKRASLESKHLSLASPSRKMSSLIDVDDEESSSAIEVQIRRSLQKFLLPPGMLEEVIAIAKENPTLCGTKATSLVDMLEETHGYERQAGWNISLLLEAIRLNQRSSVRSPRSAFFVRHGKNRIKSNRGSTQSHQDIGKDLKCSIRLNQRSSVWRRGKNRIKSKRGSTQSHQDIGKDLKCSLVDEELGCPLSEEEADKIWPVHNWSKQISSKKNGGPEKLFQALVGAVRVENCSLEVAFRGHVTSVCGTQKPDVVGWLKGWSMSPCSTGFLLCLKSSSAGAYDSDASCGQAFMYAKLLLEQAGPLKKFSVVGVSDLRHIRWFRIEPSPEQHRRNYGDALGLYVARQSLVIDKVRESICNFLTREASDVGIDLTDPTIKLFPSESTWEFIKHLGGGATSNVYSFKRGSEVLALKVPDDDSIVEDRDEQYLRQLEDVDGIPTFVEKIGKTLCMKPVGEPVVSISNIGRDVKYDGLVNLLYQAHRKRIVHRDIRPENLIIAPSQENGLRRMFLIDWGFAAPCGVATAFCGSLVTASDSILHQYKMGGNVFYKESDDLVSLVRCTYCLCYPRHYAALEDNINRPEALLKFWEGRLQIEGDTNWRLAENFALQGEYELLSSCLSLLHYTSLSERDVYK